VSVESISFNKPSAASGWRRKEENPDIPHQAEGDALYLRLKRCRAQTRRMRLSPPTVVYFQNPSGTPPMRTSFSSSSSSHGHDQSGRGSTEKGCG
jgi:hypothetical protein